MVVAKVERLRAKSAANVWRSFWQVLPLLYLTYRYHLAGIFARWRGASDAVRDAIVRQYAHHLLRRMGQQVTVIGAERLQALDYFAVAANHASNLDFAVLLGYFPTGLRFIAKKELRYIPGVGAHLKRHGVMIDRKDRKQAISAIERAVGDGDRTPILIFPEGTRSADGIPKPFKKGGLRTLLGKGVPIVPATIHGTYPNLPRGALCYSTGQPIRLIIGQPIRAADYANIDAAVAAVEAQVHQTYHQQEAAS